MKLLVFILFNLINSEAAIYGTDDRTYDESIQSYGVLAQLATNRFKESHDGITLKPKKLKDHVTNLCSDEPFANDPTFAKCSAFLVAPDILVTAGHCVHSQSDCESKRWVLSQEIQGLEGGFIPNSKVIRCEKLIDRKKNHINKNDYAVIKIKKTSVDLPYFNFSNENPFELDQSHRILYTLGHPTGLGLMNSGEAQIIDQSSSTIFKMNSDTFGGNSGSPVIDKETGLVFGILTDGDLDYKLNKNRGCIETFKCVDCRGENIVPLWNIPFLVPGEKPEDPIFDPRHPRL